MDTNIQSPHSTPFNFADRDMLVVLNTKVDQLTFDIKDLKDSLAIRVAKTESRLDAIDIYHAGIPLKDYDDIARWVENFRANYKTISIFGGIFVGIIGAVLEKMIQSYFKF